MTLVPELGTALRLHHSVGYQHRCVYPNGGCNHPASRWPCSGPTAPPSQRATLWPKQHPCRPAPPPESLRGFRVLHGPPATYLSHPQLLPSSKALVIMPSEMPLTHKGQADVEPMDLQPIWAVPKLDVKATGPDKLKVHDGFLGLVEADPLVVRGHSRP